MSLYLRVFIRKSNSNNPPPPYRLRPGSPAKSFSHQRQQPLRDRGSFSEEKAPGRSRRWSGRCRWWWKCVLLREQCLCARVGRGGWGTLEGESGFLFFFLFLMFCFFAFRLRLSTQGRGLCFGLLRSGFGMERGNRLV